jgi:hypothetical protein
MLRMLHVILISILIFHAIRTLHAPPVPDTLLPVLVSVALDLNDGTMFCRWSETMDVTPVLNNVVVSLMALMNRTEEGGAGNTTTTNSNATTACTANTPLLILKTYTTW